MELFVINDDSLSLRQAAPIDQALVTLAAPDIPVNGVRVGPFHSPVLAARTLEHDPEKWLPVFRKDHAPPMI
jgi:hypothetical protein